MVCRSVWEAINVLQNLCQYVILMIARHQILSSFIFQPLRTVNLWVNRICV